MWNYAEAKKLKDVCLSELNAAREESRSWLLPWFMASKALYPCFPMNIMQKRVVAQL